ncbi:MAG: nucleotidyltransferase domain-containing protein [Chloracidobacterium sp.]|nr:nucleotidyltransferase domain-containing protein [Chloracidobacterium sp.]
MTERMSHLLEHVLGAKSKVAALRTLFNSKVGMSGNAVAKRVGMGLLAVQNALADLERLGIVSVERGAVEHRYRLNFNHYLVQHGLRALYEAERGMVKALVSELRPLLDGRVVTAGLFGSFARGEATAGSDIDLLVIVETLKDRERVSALLSDKLSEITERYGLPVQPVIFERRRLTGAGGGILDLLEAAESDWQPVAGEDLSRYIKTLGGRKATSRRSAA